MKFLSAVGQFLMPELKKSAAELEVESQRREELGRAVERKITYESLQRHTGWTDFEKTLTKRREQLIEELLQETEVSITKAKIAELDAVRRIMSDAVRDGTLAQEELDGMNE